MKYTIEKVAGIDVIFAPLQDSLSTTVEVIAKAGSIYETKETNGISHFLEHMFFKGGKKYPTPKAVAEAVDAFGGEFNAYTADYYAGYYVKSGPAHTHKAIDVLADMLLHARFPEDELEREKGVVIQEIKMYEDNPQRNVFDKRGEYFYGDNSFGRTTIGPVANIQSFNRDMLQQHKEKLYTKDNIVIVISGAIDNKDALKNQIADLFDELHPYSTITKPDFPKYLPTAQQGQYDKGTEQNHLIISAMGYDAHDDRKYAAGILATILGGNMSSRLFQNIREKEGLCYYLGATHYAEPDHGVFFIRGGMDKGRFDFAVERIYEEINDIAQGNITEAELINAISYTTGKLQISNETSDQISSFLGMQHLLLHDIATIDENIEKFNAVTMNDVKAIAAKLTKENLYLYYIK